MKSYLVAFALILFSSILFSQNDESAVANVGNEKITAREFKLRLELSPYVPKNQDLPKDSLKYDFLYSLIAEKLWALNAKEKGIENSQQFDFFFNPIEDLFVRDALFKQEIEKKLNVARADLEKGIYKSQYTQLTRFISSNDSVLIFNFYKSLSANQNIDSLLLGNQVLSDTLVEIKFGSLNDEVIEDSVYALQAGKFTIPIKIENGWMILLFKDGTFTPIDLADSKTMQAIEKVIKDRKIEILYNEYRKNLLSGTIVKINPEPLVMLNKIVWRKIKTKTPNQNNEQSYYELSEKDFTDLLSELEPDNLSLTLFTLQKKKVTFYDFISKLAYNGFSINQLDSSRVTAKLAFMAKKFVEEQILTLEGYKNGYHLLPQVQSDLNLWKQKYLAKFYSLSILDSIVVTEEMLQSFYKNEFLKANNVVMVKLQMITLNDLDEVSNLLDKMKDGIEFGELAKFYGKTDSLLNLDGETGLVPVTLLADLADVVSKLHLNEIYGPIKRDNGYTVLKLIEKEVKEDSVSFAYNDIKNQLRSNLRFKLLNDKLNNITAELSAKYNVKIYGDAIDKVQTTQIPMFVQRLMGFGGRIAGMPLVTPFSDWMNNNIKQKLLP